MDTNFTPTKHLSLSGVFTQLPSMVWFRSHCSNDMFSSSCCLVTYFCMADCPFLDLDKECEMVSSSFCFTLA